MGICFTKSDKNNKEKNKYNNKENKEEDNQINNNIFKKNNLDIKASNKDLSIRSIKEGRNNEKKKQKLIIDTNINKGKLYENIKMLEREIISEDIVLILKNLKNHFVLFNLGQDDLEKFIEKMSICETNVNEYIFKQNDNASCYFIISKGTVQVEIDNKIIKKMKAGENFGELALLYNAPRSASIKVLEKSEFFTIHRDIFKKYLEEITIKNSWENRKYIQNISFFDNMTNEQKEKIADSLIIQKFKKGEVIVNKGDQASSYYIIKEGKVSCLDGEKEIRELKEGDTFGETALYEVNKRSLTVASKTDSKCLAIGRENLQSILGNNIKLVIQKNIQRWGLLNNNYFNKLSLIQIEKWLLNTNFKEFEKDEILEIKNSNLNNLYLIIDGQLNYGDNIYEKGYVFGQDLIDSSLKIYLKNNLITKTKCSLSMIKIGKFSEIIGGNINKAFEKYKQKIKEDKENKIKEEIELVERTKEVKSLNDLYFLRKLGVGQFGHVYLVKHKKNDKLYAIKCISKSQIAEQNIEKHILLEKKVLEIVNHKNIIKLYRTFKDNNFIYFLFEFYCGMELFDVIRQLDLLSNDQTRYFIGKTITAIEYLHSKNIIYRDLKPENILIDNKGELILIDMGIAKIIDNSNISKKTFTLVGTPHYIAPEVLNGKGYSKEIDIWSIGILIYEFMCGLVPFGEECEDPYEIYDLIIKCKLVFPDYFKTKENNEAKSIINQLLSKQPDLRLGGSFAALKAHSWFDTLDWDDLFKGKLESPYIPSSTFMMPKGEIEDQSKLKIPILNEMNKLKNNFKEINNKNDWDTEF